METGEKAAISARVEQLAAVGVTCYGLTSSEQRGGRRRPSEPGSGQSDTGTQELSDSLEIRRYREIQRDTDIQS